MKYVLLLALISVLSNVSFAKSKQITITKKSCATVTTKINTINKKMRNQYSAKQGESYRKKLRKLYKKENQCHKKRFKTK
ncbi:hypothetical protein [Thalassotalea piscium]|uniref:DUF1090 family protein n=1 Tax=Thalassotalea piscium TaxID=1230533 RepID=A0A7X0NH04_9GAMM|nr:hypothetical protein [Thalassotalea piscium]MBB6543244.1 hypothetical protein [Thalassotalea piscium]